MIDHEYTDDITCPYCGYEIEEPWEFDGAMTEDETRIECPDCEKTFASSCHISYSFSTHTVDLEKERRENEERRRVELAARDVARAEAAKWLPGTPIRVRPDARFAEFLLGREGVVDNKELGGSGYVYVVLHATPQHKRFNTSFDPDDLERL